MKIGFIGLGNVGSKLAGNLLNNGYELVVRDLDDSVVQTFVDRGATAALTAAELTSIVDVVITCLPNPAASASVVEGEEGVLQGLSEGKTWMEMSTTDADEIKRLAAMVEKLGASALECPVSGGCHRAATGNISIFAGGERATFDRLLPLLTTLGRRVLYTGEFGTASKLKVMTNYLATANLVSVCEALVTAKAADIDLNTTFEAIRISSGNSFVHETEGQVILNGSRDINFTMDLVSKDIGLFQDLAETHGVELEISPLLVSIFRDGESRYGGREFSPNIIRRLEEASGVEVLAAGFPAEIVDTEPAEPGYEVVPPR